jgi:hypothetical protein
MACANEGWNWNGRSLASPDGWTVFGVSVSSVLDMEGSLVRRTARDAGTSRTDSVRAEVLADCRWRFRWGGIEIA